MATHELFLLHFGLLGEIDAATGQPAFDQVPGYLIKTASGRNILVDTGNPASLIDAPTSMPFTDLLNITKPEDDLIPRLAELGLTIDDIDLVVTSHFDFDHCGRHDLV